MRAIVGAGACPARSGAAVAVLAGVRGRQPPERPLLATPWVDAEAGIVEPRCGLGVGPVDGLHPALRLLPWGGQSRQGLW